MYEIYFAFGLPFRVLSDPGSDGQRHARTGYLPGSERTRNGRNGISGMADLSSGLSEKRWFYKMRLGLARPTDDRSGCGRLSWISPRKEKKC